jgi:hypothetical protein
MGGMDLEFVRVWFMGLLPWAAFMFLIMILDCATGAALAAKKKVFDVEKLPQFAIVGSLFFLGWIITELLAFLPGLLGIEVQGYWEALVDYGPKAFFAFVIVTKYVASIIKHLKEIKELQVPDFDE